VKNAKIIILDEATGECVVIALSSEDCASFGAPYPARPLPFLFSQFNIGQPLAHIVIVVDWTTFSLLSLRDLRVLLGFVSLLRACRVTAPLVI
jgi:hypothetical protein